LPTLEQSLADPPVHAPDPLQVSPTLQKRPSLHVVPFWSGAVQLSVASLQLSLQFGPTLVPVQGGDACCVHAPAAQVSAPLQKSPSLHAVPVWFVQVPGLVPLQVWQSVATPPPHTVVQHTVSTQVSTAGLCWHIAVREQLPPTPLSTSQRFVVRLQKKVPGQSASELQAPWQAVLPGLHGVVAPHATGFCAGQFPLLQVTAAIACAFGIVPEQDAAAPQGVPFGTFVLQKPF
jgi:hypothetical protein